jgi:hypothetical protein
MICVSSLLSEPPAKRGYLTPILAAGGAGRKPHFSSPCSGQSCERSTALCAAGCGRRLSDQPVLFMLCALLKSACHPGFLPLAVRRNSQKGPKAAFHTTKSRRRGRPSRASGPGRA